MTQMRPKTTSLLMGTSTSPSEVGYHFTTTNAKSHYTTLSNELVSRTFKQSTDKQCLIQPTQTNKKGLIYLAKCSVSGYWVLNQTLGKINKTYS